MAQVGIGDTVRLHYVGKLENGETFDSTFEEQPAEFRVGSDQVLPGIEKAVMGMKPGERKTVDIPADDAYGTYRKDRVITVNRSRVPESVELEIGKRLQLQRTDGTKDHVWVTNLTDSEVTLDGNHPLTGQDLTFELQLVDIL